MQVSLPLYGIESLFPGLKAVKPKNCFSQYRLIKQERVPKQALLKPPFGNGQQNKKL
jgi:hypothetical protein